MVIVVSKTPSLPGATSPLIPTLLITGCGGDISLAIARIIYEEKLAQRIIGTDIHGDYPAEIAYNKVFVVPRATQPDYLNTLKSIVKKENVSLVIVQSEQELALFHKLGVREIDGVPLIMPNDKTLDICLDKLKTARFLEKNSLNFPWTIPVTDGLPKELPCILKHPNSQGSKSVHKVEKTLVNCFAKQYPDCIWQELLLPDNQEYTCGLYRSREGIIRTIQLRRKLVGGLTGFGEVTNNEKITQLLVKIAHALSLTGSINVQLRVTTRGPVIFEINPRFSSTVRFRHLLGFRDVLWQLEEYSHLQLSSFTPPKVGTRIFRAANELIL